MNELFDADAAVCIDALQLVSETVCCAKRAGYCGRGAES